MRLTSLTEDYTVIGGQITSNVEAYDPAKGHVTTGKGSILHSRAFQMLLWSSLTQVYLVGGLALIAPGSTP